MGDQRARREENGDLPGSLPGRDADGPSYLPLAASSVEEQLLCEGSFCSAHLCTLPALRELRHSDI